MDKQVRSGVGADEAIAFLTVEPLDGPALPLGHVYCAFKPLLRVDFEGKRALLCIPGKDVGEGSWALDLDLLRRAFVCSDSGIEHRPPLTGAQKVLYHSLKEYTTSMPR